MRRRFSWHGGNQDGASCSDILCCRRELFQAAKWVGESGERKEGPALEKAGLFQFGWLIPDVTLEEMAGLHMSATPFRLPSAVALDGADLAGGYSAPRGRRAGT